MLTLPSGAWQRIELRLIPLLETTRLHYDQTRAHVARVFAVPCRLDFEHLSGSRHDETLPAVTAVEGIQEEIGTTSAL